MARLVISPPKYHPSEWHASNRLNYERAEGERKSSERLRAECDRLCQEVDDTTRRTQRDVNHKFSQRINHISFWKEELEQKLGEIVAEVEAVKERKEQLEKSLQDTNLPLVVANKCLAFREQRKEVDLVHDEVEVQLMKVRIK